MKRKIFSILFAVVLMVALMLVPAVVCANGTPVIDGTLSAGEWDAYYLGTSVTAWGGGMSVDVYGFADYNYLYAAYVADTTQLGWAMAKTLSFPGVNAYFKTPTTINWPDMGYTLAENTQGYRQTDGTDWTPLSSYASGGINAYIVVAATDADNVAEIKIPLSLLTYAGTDGQIRLSGQYWQYDGATPFYVSILPPVVSNVVANPNPVAANTAVTLTATVDDTATGDSNIASAEYTLDNGLTWNAMTAADGTFDSPTEDVTATFTVPSVAGIYDLCVRGTDELGFTSDPECILLVVYDPSAGFVTGGGWIDSPPNAYMPRPAGTFVVTPANVGVDWFTNDTRYDGYVSFVNGPGSPPLGVGSLEMGSTDGNDKAQLFNYDHIGTLLADIDGITYATYRDSGSTNPPAQYPAINIEIDYVGDGSSYATLVWEPIYAYGQSNLALDTWQTWDTMAPSQTGFQGGWWSTRDIPGVCAFNCFVDWDTIVQNNPNARIKYGFGVNIGSGWNGTFIGDVDALTLMVNGETTTYDFEPVAPPTGKATFGFVSKYKKGADAPTGQTEFVFKAADLNFHSSSYDWLVVNQAGSNAQFKGWGAVNGEDGYRFMLWAGDGDPDTFRIKIWTEENGAETVIYDNGMNQSIAGGNIVVHKK